MEHHHVGLAELQSAIGPGAGFDSLVIFESYPIDEKGISEQAADIGRHVRHRCAGCGRDALSDCARSPGRHAASIRAAT